MLTYMRFPGKRAYQNKYPTTKMFLPPRRREHLPFLSIPSAVSVSALKKIPVAAFHSIDIKKVPPESIRRHSAYQKNKTIHLMVYAEIFFLFLSLFLSPKSSINQFFFSPDCTRNRDHMLHVHPLKKSESYFCLNTGNRNGGIYFRFW